jgi:hypothetical protein
MRTRLIVFARLPVEGRVKTRLAATVGTARALEVQVRLLAATLALGEACGADALEWRYDEAGAAPGSAAARLPASVAARGWRVGPQHGADLGARMREALEAALAAGDRPVLIGSDCPSLRPADLRDAFRALDDADAVFAPAEDGGYALVGLARAAPALFEGVRWGGADVMAATRARASDAGLRVALLRTVWDVDVEADLRR